MHHPLPPPTLCLPASPHRAESCVAFKKGAAANLAIVHLVLATATPAANEPMAGWRIVATRVPITPAISASWPVGRCAVWTRFQNQPPSLPLHLFILCTSPLRPLSLLYASRRPSSRRVLTSNPPHSPVIQGEGRAVLHISLAAFKTNTAI